MNAVIRPATKDDAVRVQELRKLGWRDNYVYPKGGVTKEVLETELAVLPPKQTDIDYFTNTILGNPDNASKNLVAEINCLVVGVVFYETLDNGNGTIGVFVDRDFRGYVRINLTFNGNGTQLD